MLLLTITTNAEGYLDKIEEYKAQAQDMISKLSFNNIIKLITSNLSYYLKNLVSAFGLSAATLIISIVFSSMSTSDGRYLQIFELVSKCFIIISVFPPVILCFQKVTEHIEALCGFMLSFIPTAVMLHTASGNTLSAALMSSAGQSAITVLQIVSVSAIIPLIKANCSVVTVNILCKKANLSGITSLFKSVSMWITGLYFTLFSGIMSVLSLLQSSADSLAMKGLKYSAAKLIPIAGSMVSESMKTVITSIGFIKSVTGAAGIVFIIYTIIPPICLLLITKLYLSILSALSKATSNEGFSGYFDGISSCLNLLLALLISCSVSFIIMLALFMKTNVSI